MPKEAKFKKPNFDLTGVAQFASNVLLIVYDLVLYNDIFIISLLLNKDLLHA